MLSCQKVLVEWAVRFGSPSVPETRGQGRMMQQQHWASLHVWPNHVGCTVGWEGNI
jgi:hypothetical protein